MAKSAVPGFKVRGVHVECQIGLGLVLGIWGFGGEDVEPFRGGEGASHKSGVAFVSDPALGGAEVSGIISTFVERED